MNFNAIFSCNWQLTPVCLWHIILIQHNLFDKSNVLINACSVTLITPKFAVCRVYSLSHQFVVVGSSRKQEILRNSAIKLWFKF